MAHSFPIAALVLLASGTGGLAAEEPPDWTGVSLLFTERCVMCHSAQAAALGLRLDSYQAAIAGGANGPVLVSGDAASSELVRRLRGESLPRMPFLSYPLTPEQIDLVVRWIEAGLPAGSPSLSGHENLGPDVPPDPLTLR